VTENEDMTTPEPAKAPAAKPYKWGFRSASAVILAVMVIGETVGRLIAGPAGFMGGGADLQARHYLSIAFLVSASAWALLSRGPITRFFRSMWTGVSLVVMLLISIIVGVLIPQIEGFEDPEVRVFTKRQTTEYRREADTFLEPMTKFVGGMGELKSFVDRFEGRDTKMREEILSVLVELTRSDRDYVRLARGFDGANPDLRLEIYNMWTMSGGNIDGFRRVAASLQNSTQRETHYKMFRWAEGYFLYHCLHLYGIGMPEAELPPQAIAGLERFGVKYGIEERDNRRKRMDAQFSGLAKSDEISYFVDEYDGALRAYFDVATALSLNRAYKSHWFLTLCTLLGIGIFSNTFRYPFRALFTVQRSGFFFVHLGMMVMLIGGGISKAKISRGILHLDRRDAPQDEFWEHYDSTKVARLPFHLGLDRFARKEWMQLEVEFPGFTSRPPSWTLWPGRTINLDYGEDGEPGTQLRVKALYDTATAEGTAHEAGEDEMGSSMGPIARLIIKTLAGDDGHNHAPGDTHDVPFMRLPELGRYRLMSDPEWNFRLMTNYGDATPSRLVELFPDEALGVLYCRDKRGTEVSDEPFEIKLGGVYDMPGGFTVEVQDAVANYKEDKATGAMIRDGSELGEKYPYEPAVIVYITPPGGGDAERRIVRMGVDAVETELQLGYDYPDLVLFLVWDQWKAPGPPRFVLNWGSQTEPMLVSEDGSATPVTLGMTLPLGSTTEVETVEFLHEGVLDTIVEFEPPTIKDPGEVDIDFYSRTNRGLVLEVITNPSLPEESPARTVETLKMVTGDSVTDTWLAPDDAFAIRFFENTALMPFEWRSVLSVYDEVDGELVRVDAGGERDREIRVNDYFAWKGYSFFQTNANAAEPNYSGIGVVYDPGIPVVITGMWTIILGAFLAFIVRPIVKERRKKAA
jgi:hypothetical protein